VAAGLQASSREGSGGRGKLLRAEVAPGSQGAAHTTLR